jgi:hypothetical protein
MPEKNTKKQKKVKPLAGKTIKAMELMDKGLDIHDAHKLATGIEKPHPNTIYDLKQKYNRYLLSKQSTVKLASKVFLETMKMKPVETKEIKQCPQCKGKSRDPEEPMCDTCLGQGVVKTLLYPTHSNRLDAAKEVMDRIDPIVKKTVSLNANIHAFVDFEGEAGNILGGLKSG